MVPTVVFVKPAQILPAMAVFADKYKPGELIMETTLRPFDHTMICGAKESTLALEFYKATATRDAAPVGTRKRRKTKSEPEQIEDQAGQEAAAAIEDAYAAGAAVDLGDANADAGLDDLEGALGEIMGGDGQIVDPNDGIDPDQSFAHDMKLSEAQRPLDPEHTGNPVTWDTGTVA